MNLMYTSLVFATLGEQGLPEHGSRAMAMVYGRFIRPLLNPAACSRGSCVDVGAHACPRNLLQEPNTQL